jgi:hypothetical protein
MAFRQTSSFFFQRTIIWFSLINNHGGNENSWSIHFPSVQRAPRNSVSFAANLWYFLLHRFLQEKTKSTDVKKERSRTSSIFFSLSPVTALSNKQEAQQRNHSIFSSSCFYFLPFIGSCPSLSLFPRHAFGITEPFTSCSNLKRGKRESKKTEGKKISCRKRRNRGRKRKSNFPLVFHARMKSLPEDSKQLKRLHLLKERLKMCRKTDKKKNEREREREKKKANLAFAQNYHIALSLAHPVVNRC